MRHGRRILVVEDDAPIRRGLKDALRSAGFSVLEAADGATGLASALADEADLVLLDLMLPGRSGLEVLCELRKSRPLLPVIIITALGEEDDRVRGLTLGADDYIPKPFSVRELLARVESVLRRSPSRPIDRREVALPTGTADLERNEIHFDDGSSSSLSQREAELLHYLSANAGRVVSRDEILLNVWQMRPAGIETRTIDMHVARLREKLRLSAEEGEGPLRTIRGKGYLFEERKKGKAEG
jgi:DNA-binding response OmpR family regulator